MCVLLPPSHQLWFLHLALSLWTLQSGCKALLYLWWWWAFTEVIHGFARLTFLGSLYSQRGGYNESPSRKTNRSLISFIYLLLTIKGALGLQASESVVNGDGSLWSPGKQQLLCRCLSLHTSRYPQLQTSLEVQALRNACSWELAKTQKIVFGWNCLKVQQLEPARLCLFASDRYRAEPTWMPGQSSAGSNVQTSTIQDACEWQPSNRKTNDTWY